MSCGSEFTPATHAEESLHLVPPETGPPAQISPLLLLLHLPRREALRPNLSFPLSPRSCAALNSAHSKSLVPSVPSCLPDAGPTSAHVTTAFRILGAIKSPPQRIVC